jgi:hypothetical protein
MLCFSAAVVARADVSTCPGIGDDDEDKVRMRLVTYVPSNYRSSFDARGDKETRNGQTVYRIELKGWMYFRHDADQNHPVVIYNHGHEQDRPEPCSVATYFAKRGYVVFAPLSRGHKSKSDSEFRSTGIYIDTFVDKCMREPKGQNEAPYPFFPQLYFGSPYCRPGMTEFIPNPRNAFEVDYIRSQHEDVRDQIGFVKSRQGFTDGSKFADPTRIAVLGHSWGGSLAIFANKYDYGQNVVIDVSGAELSWSDEDPFWEIDLKDAMTAQKSPMYFLQPKNGLSLAPTKVLFGVAVNKEYRSQAAIFPKTAWDPEKTKDGELDGELVPEAKQAHGNFIGTGDQVRIWGPSVIDFINRHPKALPE